jgi:glycosyltransferase 2 family protein
MVPAGLVFLSVPAILPRLVRAAARITGRTWAMPPIPSSVLWAAVAGTAAAWILYGFGFEILARAVGAASAGSPGGYVAAFTFSYLIGYLALLAPGGIVVRELALVEALRILGLASPAEGLVLALASRLWLTVLEIVLGLLFVPSLIRLPTPPVSDDAPGA